jgi:hypothetical protein
MDESNDRLVSKRPTNHVANLAKAIFHRPKMYTINGTLEEVGAFLEGYYSGMAKCQGALKEVEIWTGFLNWLSKRLSVESNGYHQLFSALRQSYPDDEEVFSKLQVWYREYWESRGGV